MKSKTKKAHRRGRETLTICLRPAEAQRLRDLAERSERSVSGEVRYHLRDVLADAEGAPRDAA